MLNKFLKYARLFFVTTGLFCLLVGISWPTPVQEIYVPLGRVICGNNGLHDLNLTNKTIVIYKVEHNIDIARINAIVYSNSFIDLMPCEYSNFVVNVHDCNIVLEPGCIGSFMRTKVKN